MEIRIKLQKGVRESRYNFDISDTTSAICFIISKVSLTSPKNRSLKTD